MLEVQDQAEQDFLVIRKRNVEKYQKMKREQST